MGGIGATQQQAAFASASTLRLSLGSVSAADQIFINDVQLGATGDVGSPGCEDNFTFCSHIVPPGLLKPTGDVIAVCVYAGRGYPGSLHDSCAPDKRGGAYDAGANREQRQTGHAVTVLAGTESTSS